MPGILLIASRQRPTPHVTRRANPTEDRPHPSAEDCPHQATTDVESSQADDTLALPGPKGNIASQVKRRRALSHSPVKPATRPYEQPQTRQARLGDSCRRLRLRLPWGAPVSVWPGGILFVTAGKGKKGAEKLVDLLMHELAHQ